MPRQPADVPTDGEIEILRILWRLGPASLGELCTALREEREVATTTVATMLKVMLSKGLVHRKSTTQGYRWLARLDQRSAARGMTDKLLDGVFEGSAQRLVAHLFEEGQLRASDRKALERLFASADKRRDRPN